MDNCNSSYDDMYYIFEHEILTKYLSESNNIKKNILEKYIQTIELELLSYFE